MIVPAPNYRMPPPDLPRRITVGRDHGDQERLMVAFTFSGGGGHAELLTLAEAEVLAEHLAAWISRVRHEQIFGASRQAASA